MQGQADALDRGVSPHAILLAQRLAVRRAVNITDDNRLGILVLSAKGVPIGLHLFAMPSPRREELDESRLARLHDNFVPILLSQLDSSARGAGQEAHKGKVAQHDYL